MSLELYNTLMRRQETFTPMDPQRVTMYVCGPTVYNYAHIGNARPAVVFDVLYRLLRHEFPDVVYARNITDVDDKINAAARVQGVDFREITEKFAEIYRQDMRALGVLDPDVEPKVTDHIPQLIDMVQRLLDKGHAYEADGHVLFDVGSFPEYGQLSRRNRDDMIAGARVEVAPYKRDPADFVLWKPSDADTPGWDSPWGRGRPGWHLECSTMIETHLGRTIDIHGGGQDLIFPHHENEIAQGCCAHDGAPYVRYWLHNGFVTVEGEKMAKSVGNVLLVHDLLAEAPGEAVRLTLLSAHYRQPLDWTAEALAQSRKTLDRLYLALRELADVEVDPADCRAPEPFVAALSDDLNTPKAFAALHSLAKAANTAQDDAARQQAKRDLLGAGWLLGILQQGPEAWFNAEVEVAELDKVEIEQALEERRQARKARDFSRADQIRDDLAARGVIIEDRPEGTIWRYGS